MLHQLVDFDVGLLDELLEARDDFDQVVGCDVGGHADGDAGGAVDEQVGVRGGEDLRLGFLAVVVRLEIDGVLIEICRHGQCRMVHAALGVPHCGGAGVE